MFKVVNKKLGKFTKIVLVNSKTKEYVSVIPDFGANINELVLMKNNKLYSLIEGDRTSIELVHNRWFRGAKLIPFLNRINGGRYSFDSKVYDLFVNFPSQGHAIHGLVYNKSFRIIKVVGSKANAKLSLEYEGMATEGYPFRFLIRIDYILDVNGFRCNTSIFNKNKIKMPVGDGWHPYFKLNCKVDDLFLKMPPGKKIEVNKLMIPSGQKIIYDNFSNWKQIKKTKFDTCFEILRKKNMAITQVKNNKLGITLQLWQQIGKNKYNYVQIFTHPSRKSIAIEPMTCNIDAFNNTEGLVILSPNRKFCASYGVKLI